MKIKELAKAVLKKIDAMTELLYQEKEKEGYEILNQVVADMQSLIAEITNYQQETNQRVVDEAKLLSSVGEAFGAMQEKDIVLLADIFNYDVKEQLEQIIQA